jgi:PAS domain S-box-containing protein
VTWRPSKGSTPPINQAGASSNAPNAMPPETLGVFSRRFLLRRVFLGVETASMFPKDRIGAAHAGKQSRRTAASTQREVQALVRELQKKQLALELRNEELKQAHQQAEASRRRFTHLYDFAPVGYFTMNPLGAILEVNRAGTLLLGQEKETLINRRLQSCLAPEAGPVFNGFLQRIFAQRKHLRCELALLKNNGVRVEVQIEGLVLRGEADGPEHCLATIVDITRRKQAERERERLILELQDALKKVRT